MNPSLSGYFLDRRKRYICTLELGNLEEIISLKLAATPPQTADHPSHLIVGRWVSLDYLSCFSLFIIESLRSESRTIMANNNHPEIQYYVRHCDPNCTREGLGSHARGTLYPLWRVSCAFGWKILWQPSEQPCWSAKGNTARPEYQDECQNLGEWLHGRSGIAETFEDWVKQGNSGLTVVNINLDVDPRLGRILGSSKILMDSIQDHLDSNGAEDFYCQNVTTIIKSKKILVSLNGRFRYQDDPTVPVIRSMQERCRQWRRQQLLDQREKVKLEGTGCFRVVAHIRVPEDFCSQEWKDANSIEHILKTLRVVTTKLKQAQPKGPPFEFSLDIFTEACFPVEQEQILRQELDSCTASIMTLHRQTPLLPCVQAMATADLLIPASSFLSAFAGFFQTSLIVLPNEATRQDKFFLPHLLHSKTASASICPTRSRENGMSTEPPVCKIVRVEDEEATSLAIGEAVRSWWASKELQ